MYLPKVVFFLHFIFFFFLGESSTRYGFIWYLSTTQQVPVGYLADTYSGMSAETKTKANSDFHNNYD